MRVVLALGGNALLRRGDAPDATIQIERIERAAAALARAASAAQLVITHGNGPQVGLLARESSDDHDLSRGYPLDALVAETQGLIGYWLQRAIGSAGLEGPVVSLVTQTVVDGDDVSFDAPAKFIGATYPPERLAGLEALGWTMRQDGAGWRRVVPSPSPIHVVESPVVATLLEAGTTVVCAGGGGAPVTRDGSRFVGVEAVVDKDRVAALLALELDADQLVLLTDVPGIIDGFGTPDATLVPTATVDELDPHRFAAGSMRPKVEAACSFTRQTGRPSVIGSLDDLSAVLRGDAGTRITR